MKQQVLGTVIMIILGFVAIAAFILTVFPVVGEYNRDAVSKKPTIPTASVIQYETNSLDATGLHYSL